MRPAFLFGHRSDKETQDGVEYHEVGLDEIKLFPQPLFAGLCVERRHFAITEHVAIVAK
jgi:hypothetical protein